ncbi:MAG TPA: hypothetical protein VGL93_32215 [Streptosporangiaceae bacterium]|jgi:hypothetical protein
MAEVMADPATERFGHREHVHVTWLAVRRYGMPTAIDLVSAGLQRTARYAGAPQKYNATVSRAWVELVAFHAAEHDDPTFAALATREPALLNKRLLTHFYRPKTLAHPDSKHTWTPPDLAPFPWPR